jgi:hypothetical protein
MIRQRLHETVEHKERRIANVLSLQADMIPGVRLAAPDALHHMLEKVTAWEWALMGCFSASTPLPLVHKLLSGEGQLEKIVSDKGGTLDIEKFFTTMSALIRYYLCVSKYLVKISTSVYSNV